MSHETAPAYDEMPRALGRGAISPNQIQPK
jgi:hypothetical protein